MDKKRLEYYKKKLLTRRDELVKTITRTEEEGRQADDDPTVDLADKAANSYTKEFLFGQTSTDRNMLNLIDEALKRIRNEEYGQCLVARKRCRLSGSTRYLGPSTAFPARRKWNRACCNPQLANRLPNQFITEVNKPSEDGCAAGHVALLGRGFRWCMAAGLCGPLTSVVFPAGCRLCEAPLTHARRVPICEHCLACFQPIPCHDLQALRPGFASLRQCSESAATCRDCSRTEFSFSGRRSFGVYEGALSRAIMLFKYERIEPLGTCLRSNSFNVVQANNDSSLWM